MEFAAGTRITVLGHKVGVRPRSGAVLDRLPSGALRVSWDDGGESVFVPGSDVLVEQTSSTAGETRFGCQIDMQLIETDEGCKAEATLMTQRGTFRSHAQARRHPDDARVPMIGEELAIARALHLLAGQLETAATDAITHGEDRNVHLL